MTNERISRIIKESLQHVLKEEDDNNGAGVDIDVLKTRYYALTSAMEKILDFLRTAYPDGDSRAQEAFEALINAYNKMQPLVSKPNGLKIWE